MNGVRNSNRLFTYQYDLSFEPREEKVLVVSRIVKASMEEKNRESFEYVLEYDFGPTELWYKYGQGKVTLIPKENASQILETTMSLVNKADGSYEASLEEATKDVFKRRHP